MTFLKKIFLICFLPLIFLIIGQSITLWISSRVNHSFEEFLELQHKKESLLNEMTYSLGYTGGIHAFKNYILRQDESYYHQASVKLKDTLFSLKMFKNFLNSGTDEVSLLNIIENTVKKYLKNLELARGMILLDKDQVKIDKVVKVDDGPADNALKRLRNLLNGEKRVKIEELNRNLYCVLWIEVIFIVISITAGLGLSSFYYRGIQNSLRALNLISLNIRKGDSIQEAEILGKMPADELKDFAQHLNEMGKQLREGVEALKKSNQELSQYAYFISHDLKAPIRKVSNCSDLLSISLKDDDKNNIDKYMKLIKENCIEMLELNKAVLNLSDTKSGEISKEDFDFKHMLENVLDKMTYGDLKKIPLEANIKISKIHGNKKLLESLLFNLISNSIKYKHPERNLKINLTVMENTELYLFTLEDNGVGLEPSKIEKALQPFSRLGENSEKKGYGIGLSLSQQIVHAHGGELNIESEKGMGLKVEFSLKKPLV